MHERGTLLKVADSLRFVGALCKESLSPLIHPRNLLHPRDIPHSSVVLHTETGKIEVVRGSSIPRIKNWESNIDHTVGEDE